MAKVSLKSIAKEFDVSTATVSLVLNGKDKNGRVSKALSEKILQMAKELNYMPNSLAKGLRAGNSKTLGLIVADITNVFFGSLAFQIQEKAEIAGYTVIIGNTNENIDKMSKMVDLLRRRQVDGFIITPTEGSEHIIQSILEHEIPLVLVDRYFPDLRVCSVTINNYQISYDAVQSLIKKGCKKIGVIVYVSDNQSHMNDRKNGYLQAVTDANILDQSLINEVSYTNLENDIDQAVTNLLYNGVDGIFFATNSISIIGLRKIISMKNFDFAKINYMCFDENDAYCLLPFKIPYVKQPIKEMAEKAVNQIIDQIENKNQKCRNSVVDAVLILE